MHLSKIEFFFFSSRLDCWESDQERWIPTVKVLEHHQGILNSITNANNAANCTVKKQKLDVENLNSNYLLSYILNLLEVANK